MKKTINFYIIFYSSKQQSLHLQWLGVAWCVWSNFLDCWTWYFTWLQTLQHHHQNRKIRQHGLAERKMYSHVLYVICVALKHEFRLWISTSIEISGSRDSSSFAKKMKQRNGREINQIQLFCISVVSFNRRHTIFSSYYIKRHFVCKHFFSISAETETSPKNH